MDKKPTIGIMDQSITNNIMFRLVKIMDIGYVACFYFIIGLIASRLFDKYFGLFDPKNEDKKSIYQVGLELIGMIWLIGVSTYVVRNLAEFIPSPLDGIYGFKHSKLKELGGAAVYSLIFMGYAYHFRAKLDYFNKRLNKGLDLPIPAVYLTPINNFLRMSESPSSIASSPNNPTDASQIKPVDLSIPTTSSQSSNK
jgi:hypothetical protein